MEKIKEELKCNKKGITLISLVVTIVVLLILAGVSIGMLTGDNGILKQASEAKKQTETASKNEKYDLSKIEDLINESQTGIVVEQVTDINPGVLEGTGSEENPYVINSIEDLVFFAYDVTNGNNYNDQTVTLGLSLDFNSSKSYVDPLRTDYGKYGYDGELKTLLTTGEGFLPIGFTNDSDTKNFYGNFNGMDNFINNLYINKVVNSDEHVKYGFFTNVKGTIYNLKLLNVNMYLNAKDTGYIGGICGQNSSTAIINNCIVSGKIKNESTNGATGGITYYSSGKIINSGNFCDISSKTGNFLGGICGATGGSATVENSFNLGNISYNGSIDTLSIGGIVGVLDYGTSINNCFNTGEVFSEKINNILSIGGCIGNSRKNANISNCYNIGKVSGSTNENIYIGCVIGKVENSILNNLYYKEFMEITGFGSQIDIEGMKKTDEEMKSNSFIELLNKDNFEAFKQDTQNINQGYPILSWQ